MIGESELHQENDQSESTGWWPGKYEGVPKPANAQKVFPTFKSTRRERRRLAKQAMLAKVNRLSRSRQRDISAKNTRVLIAAKKNGKSLRFTFHRVYADWRLTGPPAKYAYLRAAPYRKVRALLERRGFELSGDFFNFGAQRDAPAARGSDTAVVHPAPASSRTAAPETDANDTNDTACVAVQDAAALQHGMTGSHPFLGRQVGASPKHPASHPAAASKLVQEHRAIDQPVGGETPGNPSATGESDSSACASPAILGCNTPNHVGSSCHNTHVVGQCLPAS